MKEQKYDPEKAIEELSEKEKIYLSDSSEAEALKLAGFLPLVHNELLSFLKKKKPNGFYILYIVDPERKENKYPVKIKYEGKEEVEGKKKEKYKMPEWIKKLLEQEGLWNYIVCEELDKKHKGDIATKEIIFLCCIGRLVKNKKPFSFNSLILSPSSSGKDHLVASVLKLIPKEDIEVYGRISAKALNYLHTVEDEPDYDYDGKIMYLKEITEEILNNEVMKEFTSGEDKISKVAITKQKGGGIDVKTIRGHPEVFTTTATTIPNEEIRNRFNVVGLDTSEEQTGLSFMEEELKHDEDILKYISNLKPRDIEIPKKIFNFIKNAFPKNKVRYRRDFQKLLDYVKTLALFHGRKIAEPEDYDRAKDIFMNAFSTSADIPLKDLEDRIVKILEKIKEPMYATQILNELGGIISKQALYPKLRNLVMKEILEELTDRTPVNDKGIGGYVIQNYVLTEEFKEKKHFKLPNYNEDSKDSKDNKDNKDNKHSKAKKEGKELVPEGKDT